MESKGQRLNKRNSSKWLAMMRWVAGNVGGAAGNDVGGAGTVGTAGTQVATILPLTGETTASSHLSHLVIQYFIISMSLHPNES